MFEAIKGYALLIAFGLASPFGTDIVVHGRQQKQQLRTIIS
jgi:hypothetical protein